MTEIPTCCVTGRIAGDPDACGDCDPCGAQSAVPVKVRDLINEKEEWRQKYSDAASRADFAHRQGWREGMEEAARIAGNWMAAAAAKRDAVCYEEIALSICARIKEREGHE